MAKLGKNSLLHGASGRIGNLVLRQVNGKTILCNAPAKRKADKLTEHQIETRRRFVLATEYARAHMTNPELKALYETGITKKKRTAYLVAMSDYLKPPSIRAIEFSGNRGKVGKLVLIDAVDDFKVVSVYVKIESAGSLIECGEAKYELSAGGSWRYVVTKNNGVPMGSIVTVSAEDFAGNVATRMVTVD
ncbi:MAG: hypothetical protein ABIS36_23235 [Chryseolinea sp.]